MLFNSYFFLLFFLPSFFVIIKFNNQNIKNKNISILFLIIFSIWFYFYDNINFGFLLLFSIFFNFLFSIQINQLNNNNLRKKILFYSVIIFNLLILIYFKYLNYFVSFFKLFYPNMSNKFDIYLPLAISFYTFQQISFQIDNYKKKYSPGFFKYLLYIFFFPQLIAGPIIRFSHFFKEINNKIFLKLSSTNFVIGISIIVLGLFKKVMFADTAGLYVDSIFNEINNGNYISGFDAFLFIIFFSLQIYFDFSAYSDIAVGIGKILNFNIPINFNSPFKATSIIDFWKRWHISLSQFFRDYVYIPLGGNKNIFINKLILIVAVMTIVGLWHGSTKNFLVWGLIHGVLISINHIVNRFKFFNFLKNVPAFIKIIFIFIIVSIAFVFFRIESFDLALKIIYKSIQYNNYFLNCYFFDNISSLNKLILIISIFVTFFMPNIFQIFDLKYVNIKKVKRQQNVKFQFNFLWTCSILFLFSIIIFNLGNPNVFIYFRF